MIQKILSIITLSTLTVFGGNANPGEEVIEVKIGVTSGPHVEVMEFVREMAKEKNMNMRIVEFNDYIIPNVALADGTLDMNCYQHEPFLNDQIASRGYKLTAIGKALLFPMGVYSEKLTKLSDIQYKGKVAIPNDPTNGGRALLLLQREGLITLKEDSGISPGVMDIAENPKKLKITELEAPQIPRVLEDVDAAVINTDWAILAGKNPEVDAIARESRDSPYANIFVVRTEDKENADLRRVVELYQSPETEAFVKETYNGSVLPAWN